MQALPGRCPPSTMSTPVAHPCLRAAPVCRCRQLLSEQEVQARAADAARANVEAHYHHILTSYHTFLDKWVLLVVVVAVTVTVTGAHGMLRGQPTITHWGRRGARGKQGPCVPYAAVGLCLWLVAPEMSGVVQSSLNPTATAPGPLARIRPPAPASRTSPCRRYTAQHAAHALLLSTFPHDLAALEAIPLHPALQTWVAPGLCGIQTLTCARAWGR